MRSVQAVIEQISDTDVTVLIQGESGVGKEIVARSLHAHSSRSKRPFVKVNCAALPEELLESELFGYEKGAFTGANSRKQGRFELAHSGILFLDEIVEMSRVTQVKHNRNVVNRPRFRFSAFIGLHAITVAAGEPIHGER